MLNEFSRSELLLGSESLEILSQSHIAVFGLGGVGAYCVEALARSGIGSFTLFDDDRVCKTNINRQLIATQKTIGQLKVDVMAQRIHDIYPAASIKTHALFYTTENADSIDLSSFSYIVDAIDTVSAKLALIERAKKNHIPIISCMGAGNKLDPTKFVVTDIYNTSICPLARVMRHELRKRNIDSLKVVYSTEPPLKPLEIESSSCRNHCVCPDQTTRTCTARRQIPGSVSFVPPVAGLIAAGEVVKDLTSHQQRGQL